MNAIYQMFVGNVLTTTKPKTAQVKKMRCINCVRHNECIPNPSEHSNEKDHYAFQNSCPVYQNHLQLKREEDISALETKKQMKQQKPVTPTQEHQQQICQTITDNIKDQMQNMIKENEITKTKALQEKLCENITNNLKAQIEKIFKEQITIQLETTTVNETPTKQETAQTPSQQTGWSTSRKKNHITDPNRGVKCNAIDY
ncbi:hypothetical protein CEXT_702831 [Caerostris extrusa]|uniref:Uncharacterized protein n=1 Tax=Caerostris extrusa TaxID=172846 RepID=A0AAV4N9I5_CAEEX|nr:hypothetical protein CEXT_702831 [Caerostris extrusa]